MPSWLGIVAAAALFAVGLSPPAQATSASGTLAFVGAVSGFGPFVMANGGEVDFYPNDALSSLGISDFTATFELPAGGTMNVGYVTTGSPASVSTLSGEDVSGALEGLLGGGDFGIEYFDVIYSGPGTAMLNAINYTDPLNGAETIFSFPVSSVSEPPALALFGAAFAGLVFTTRRRGGAIA